MKDEKNPPPPEGADDDIDAQVNAVSSHMPVPLSGGSLHLVRALLMATKHGEKKPPEDSKAD